jgi:transposase
LPSGQQFLAAGAAHHLKLLRLFMYAPELNPDEGVWRWLKRVALGNVCCDTLAELQYELRLAMAQLWHRNARMCCRSAFAAQG